MPDSLFEITVKNREVLDSFDAIPVSLAREKQNILFRGAEIVADEIIDHLSGEFLKVQTGRLRSSIIIGGTGREDEARIWTNVEYAAIHEFGGIINRPEMVAKPGRVFVFPVAGRMVFTRRIRPTRIVMPARRYVSIAVEDTKEEVLEYIASEVRELVESIS
ncbi:MAG: HK97 gp10 family phage protein [Proteobacteria bacterium]|nr:HK97 gp10 family phage protein [Pseudomonadota bacterium]